MIFYKNVRYVKLYGTLYEQLYPNHLLLMTYSLLGEKNMKKYSSRKMLKMSRLYHSQ